MRIYRTVRSAYEFSLESKKLALDLIILRVIGRRKFTMYASEKATAMMKGLAELYVKAGFPNHHVWAFSPDGETQDNAFNELKALGLIKAFASGGMCLLTDAGQQWVMENRSEETG
jgi:hypothetical protein